MLRYDLIAGWRLNADAGQSRADVMHARPLLEVNGQTPPVDGKVGRAASFTGGTNILREQNGPLIVAGMSFTMAAWVRRGAGSTLASICLYQTGAATRQYIGFNGTTGVPIFAVNGTTQNDGSSLPVGEWSHLAMTYQAETAYMRTYVNGQTVATRTLAATFNAPTGIVVGVGNLIADVDEAYIWQRALSPYNVSDLYNAGMAGRTYPFTDGKGH